eukprot:COSAG02_NODE_6412_length_3588_cov_1.797650_4_plen_142_part_00
MLTAHLLISRCLKVIVALSTRRKHSACDVRGKGLYSGEVVSNPQRGIPIIDVQNVHRLLLIQRVQNTYSDSVSLAFPMPDRCTSANVPRTKRDLPALKHSWLKPRVAVSFVVEEEHRAKSTEEETAEKLGPKFLDRRASTR